MGGIKQFFEDDSIKRWAVDDSIARLLRHAFAREGTGKDTLTKIYNVGGVKMVSLPAGDDRISSKVYSKTIVLLENELAEVLGRGHLQGETLGLTLFFDEVEAKDTRKAIALSVGARKW